jgi:hypothetical protein
MGLIYIGMAILALLGAVGIVYWVRKSGERMSCGMIGMVMVLLVAGISMFYVAWKWG